MSKPTPKPTPSRPYYVIEALAVEWQYVIRTILRETKYELEDAQMQFMEGGIRYLLSRSAFPAETLARHFGTTTDIIENAAVIRLHPIDRENPPPKQPTVIEWGEA